MRFTVHVGVATQSKQTLEQAMDEMEGAMHVNRTDIADQLARTGQAVAIRGMTIGRIIDHSFAKNRGTEAVSQMTRYARDLINQA